MRDERKTGKREKQTKKTKKTHEKNKNIKDTTTDQANTKSYQAVETGTKEAYRSAKKTRNVFWCMEHKTDGRF